MKSRDMVEQVPTLLRRRFRIVNGRCLVRNIMYTVSAMCYDENSTAEDGTTAQIATSVVASVP